LFHFNIEDKLEAIFGKIIQKVHENPRFLKENIEKE